MQLVHPDLNAGFAVAAGNARSQAAVMVLQAGESTGPPRNEHAASEQWLYVVSGRGRAVVAEQSFELAPGALLLVERGEPHSIANTGEEPLRTLNVYVPPAYEPDGDLIRR